MGPEAASATVPAAATTPKARATIRKTNLALRMVARLGKYSFIVVLMVLSKPKSKNEIGLGSVQAKQQSQFMSK